MNYLKDIFFILGTKSPRRIEFLKNLDLHFEVVASDFNEKLPDSAEPIKYVTSNSVQKACAIAEKIPDKLIASFDTIVVHDNTVLGKPLNRNHAFDMLNLLSGKTHKVITSYTLYQKQYSLNRTKFVITEVTFKSLKDDEINWYINTDEPYDKAGAYAIQGIGAFMVKGIRGSYTNVVGLPLSEFLEDLLKIKDILKIGM
jgi:septum formation protein